MSYDKTVTSVIDSEKVTKNSGPNFSTRRWDVTETVNHADFKFR